ncbi:MAG: hypothetical protein ABI193_16305 [Minicystis sp.]
MWSKLVARSSRANLFCLLTFIVGTVIRWRYIFVVHDPRNSVDSDMKLYIDLAKRYAQPNFVPGVGDVMHPPGAAFVFSRLYRADPTLLLACRFQFVITALLPLVVLALGVLAFGKNTGKVAFAISCLYFPFIDYGGYFLTEIPMAILMTATIAVFLWATQRVRPGAVFAGALAAGFVCSLAMAYKFLAMPVMLCFAGVHWLFYVGPTRRMKTLAVVGLLAGSIPLTAALTSRCTTANMGRFCLISSKGPADFLLGHYGRIESLRWISKDGHSSYTFGSPSAFQHGYRGKPEVHFALTDGKENSEEAVKWIKQNPTEAAVLSLEHVYDIFCGAMPWPGAASGFWMMSEVFHFVFIVLLLIPCLLFAFDLIKTHGFRGYLGRMEFLVFSPILGLMAAVAIATGEPRYRVPFDTIFIVLAAEFYRRYLGPALGVQREKDEAVPAPKKDEALSVEPNEAKDDKPSPVEAKEDKPSPAEVKEDKAEPEAPAESDDQPLPA